MKPKVLVLVFAILSLQTHAQYGERSQRPQRFSDRLFYGGTIGLMVGDVTRIDLQPIAGIWLFPQWSLGVGGRYGFHSQRAQFMTSNAKMFRSHIWGASAFTQILPIRNLSEVTPLKVNGGIFFHGEYEALYFDQKLLDPLASSSSGRVWKEIMLGGVGYRQILGERAALNIIFLWTLKGEARVVYTQNPIIRVNVTF